MAKDNAIGCTVPKLLICNVPKYLRLHDQAGDVVMLHGAAGIGKSEIVRQYADTYYPLRTPENLEKLELLRSAIGEGGITQEMVDKFEDMLLDQDTNFVDVRLSYYEPTDLSGIPLPVTMYYDQNGKVVQEWERTPEMVLTKRETVVWATPSMFSMPKNWKGVILFDELPSTPPAVQAACYQLMLDNKIGDWELSPHAFKIAAGNRECDGGAMHYGIATPLKDRMSHYEVDYDVPGFIEYARKTGVDAEIIAYIRHAPSRLHTLDPESDSPVGGTSPRSWVRVSKLLKEMRAIYDISPDRISPDVFELMRNMVASRVGIEIASEFMAYRKNFGIFPTPAEILTGNYDIEALKDIRMSSDMVFFICNNLNSAMHDVYKVYLRKKLAKEQWISTCVNYLTFIDDIIGKHEPEQSISAIKYLMHSTEGLGVIILGSDVPMVNDIIQKYTHLMSRARSLN